MDKWNNFVGVFGICASLIGCIVLIRYGLVRGIREQRLKRFDGIYLEGDDARRMGVLFIIIACIGIVGLLYSTWIVWRSL